jgi:hypothetical protein
MGKRLLTLVAMVAGIALLIAGVALATDELGQTDEPTTATAVTVDPADVDEPTTSTTAGTETPVVGEEVTVDSVPTSPHDGDWGTYISGLREDGDNTPAAVLMGKTVPGWEKKHPSTTETSTTEAPSTEAPSTEQASGQQTTGDGHGHGHSKK